VTTSFSRREIFARRSSPSRLASETEDEPSVKEEEEEEEEVND